MRSVVVAFIAAVTVSLSCGSSTSPSSGSNAGSKTPTLTGIINNIPWTANGPITATFTPVTSSLAASNLNMTAQDSPLTQTLQITVSPTLPGTPLTAGAYLVGSTNTTALLTVVGGSSFLAGPNSGSGSVTIDSLSTTSKTASGTFNFVLREINGPGTRTITSGSFSVTFN